MSMLSLRKSLPIIVPSIGPIPAGQANVRKPKRRQRAECHANRSGPSSTASRGLSALGKTTANAHDPSNCDSRW